MRNDILNVISKYVVLDRSTLRMEIQRQGDSLAFLANIQVIDVVRS